MPQPNVTTKGPASALTSGFTPSMSKIGGITTNKAVSGKVKKSAR